MKRTKVRSTTSELCEALHKLVEVTEELQYTYNTMIGDTAIKEARDLMERVSADIQDQCDRRNDCG